MQQQVSPLAQQVAGGIFPYVNRIEVVGQVFPTKANPTGVKWVNAQQQGQDGHASITLKMLKSWNGRTPGKKQSKLTVVAYGQFGQGVMQQLRPGMMLRVVGELKVSNFQSTGGQNTGQWITTVSIQIGDGKTGEVPFEILGVMPVQDDSRQAQQPQLPQFPPQYGAPPQPQYPPNPAYPPGPPPQQYPAYAPPMQSPQYGAPVQGNYTGQPQMPPTAQYSGGPVAVPQQQQQPQYPPQQQQPQQFAPQAQQYAPQAQQPQQAPQYAPQPQPAAPGAPTGTFLPTPQGAFPGQPMNPQATAYVGGTPINASDIPF
jgi:single-stranded DNA-binding protein